ncbi:essential meiotic endonuclease 1A [Striga asiatica]|uniref:Essential meiotic endonuclease 1A n=1 Tax=Striga asiatica TaxID=4170 RepID=A0A5A7PBT1_STRAF|nr:essential meiotic endonuclease 1A [Striga asiatica]
MEENEREKKEREEEQEKKRKEEEQEKKRKEEEERDQKLREEKEKQQKERDQAQFLDQPTMDNTPQTLTTTVATRILHEDTDDDEEADGEGPCDLETWETLRNSFKEVQSVLDHNRRLIHWLTTITCPKSPQFGQECQFDSPRSPASPPPSRTPLGTAAPPATMSSRRCRIDS